MAEESPGDIVSLMIARKDLAELAKDPLPKGWTTEARRIWEYEPQKYLELLGQICGGNAITRIARENKVTLQTVRAIRNRHPAAIEAFQESVRLNVEEALQRATERLSSEVDDIPIAKIPFALEKLWQSYRDITGQATERREVKVTITHEDLQKMFESLPES